MGSEMCIRDRLEEDRAIRLFVTGRISEEQLDHQRRFITERLERARAELDAARERETAAADQRRVMEEVVEWAERADEGLDGLSDAERREVLNLLLEEGSIDGENNVTLTLAIPTDEFVSIEPSVSAWPFPPPRGARPWRGHSNASLVHTSWRQMAQKSHPSLGCSPRRRRREGRCS